MKWLMGFLAAVVIATPAQAQKIYTQAELDALLAPIALQTDGVLSQVLMAATYPEDVAAAAAWSRAYPHLKGEAAVRAADHQPWDPSVRSLLAFPELLARMAESPEWLRDLGEAFLGQQAQVMDTVQGLRRRAQANGQLETSADTAVYQQGEAIVVQPRAQVVYVRYYDPYVVYGPWWWGPHYRPVVWRAWSPYPLFFTHGFFYSAPDWHHRHVRVVHRPVYVHRYHDHVVPGRWQHRPPVHRAQAPVHRIQAPTHRAQPQVQVQPHVRVPEAQRRPIVQQHQQQRQQQQQQQQQQPLQKQPMPAANGYSHPKRAIAREHERREHRAEPRREHRGGGDHRGGGEHGGQRGHRG